MQLLATTSGSRGEECSQAASCASKHFAITAAISLSDCVWMIASLPCRYISKGSAGVSRASGDRQFTYLNGRPVDMPSASLSTRLKYPFQVSIWHALCLHALLLAKLWIFCNLQVNKLVNEAFRSLCSSAAATQKPMFVIDIQAPPDR